MLVEQGEVELQLAGEVLVENGLADSRALRDVVHRRGVVALGDEDLLRGAQQLIASGTAGQPGARGRAASVCSMAVTPPPKIVFEHSRTVHAVPWGHRTFE